MQLALAQVSLFNENVILPFDIAYFMIFFAHLLKKVFRIEKGKFHKCRIQLKVCTSLFCSLYQEGENGKL